MLTHPTLEKLQAMRLTGMAKAFAEQLQLADSEALSAEERIGLLVDREWLERDNRRHTTRLRTAKLRHHAAVEDIDYRHPRGLDRALMAKLATSAWLREHLNCLIVGPTGIGKSWLACALAQKACRDGFSALYLRAPRFFRDLSLAKGDGRYPKLMRALAKTDLVDAAVLANFARAIRPQVRPLKDADTRALDDLVRVGKVRYVGCSNYPAWRLAKALWAWHCRTRT